MYIGKSTCGKTVVPLKKSQSQFHPYVLFVSQIKKTLNIGLLIKYQVKSEQGPINLESEHIPLNWVC